MATIKVGDLVTVPGDMYGTVKFIGAVMGKKGTFAGVQLAPEYEYRGKNSGDVDGKYYFRTTVAGSGIFLPLDKAVKRASVATDSPTSTGTRKITPPSAIGSGTPSQLTSYNQGGRTPAGLPRPNFSQSVGPGGPRSGAASPALKPPVRRESMPRPGSPLRKINTPATKAIATPKVRPSIGMNRSVVGQSSQYRASPATRGPSLTANKFTQSLRQSSTTPSRGAPSPLGPESSFDELPEEEADFTPTPTPQLSRNVEVNGDSSGVDESRLKKMLAEKDAMLREQAASIAEMERNLNELQKLIPDLSEDGRKQADEEEGLPRDVRSLRAALRMKNEKIQMLTMEFDANRAEFRSTIDTLSMANTETERIYEKRVDELLEELRTLQDRNEDVETVAQQLKQLEELVAELEEGLEDARRGEAEARSEVEFLRGEVERSKSELRRERERARTEEQLNGLTSPGGPVSAHESRPDRKEEETRQLRGQVHNRESGSALANGHLYGHSRNDSNMEDTHLDFQEQIRNLEALLQQKSAHEEELENEVTKLRNSVHLNSFPMPGSAFGMRTGPVGGHGREHSTEYRDRHQSSGTNVSQRTVVPGHERKNSRMKWFDAESRNNSKHSSLQEYDRMVASSDLDKDSEGDQTDASSAALWCEICEEGGHDILTCVKMFDPQENTSSSQQPGRKPTALRRTSRNGRDVVREGLARNSSQQNYSANKHNSDQDQLPEPLSLSSGPGPVTSYSPPKKPPTGTRHGSGTNIGVGAALSAPPTGNLPPRPTSQSYDEKRNPRRTSTNNNNIVPSSPTEAQQRRTSSNLTPVTSNTSTTVGPGVGGIKSSNTEDRIGEEVKEDPNTGIIEGTGDQAGMYAGKTSRVIDPNKWCALCERDGHDSVDCPVEDGF